MSYIKSEEEIKLLAEGGKILGEILEKLANMVEPGISAASLDVEAEKMILSKGGKPAFKGYRSRSGDTPFPCVICASVNAELVHGLATEKKILKNGDLFSIDIGMQYPAGIGQGQNGDGFFTDTALTVPVGNIAARLEKLLKATQKALEVGIKSARPGKTVADIGKNIENWIKPRGYGIVRDLVGHGVGHKVHEEPRVPNYFDRGVEKWRLSPGVVLAIEPMFTLGEEGVKTGEDGWSVETIDGSMCAHFEHTIVITKGGPRVLTRRPSEKRK